MRDGPPPRNRPGRAAVFGPAPPNPQRTGNKNGKRSASRKKNDYFVFNLLIVNHINQYFNICLHLIRFITYNRRIFIAKYLFENKTCSIFAYVKITESGAPEAYTSPEGTGKSNDKQRIKQSTKRGKKSK